MVSHNLFETIFQTTHDPPFEMHEMGTQKMVFPLEPEEIVSRDENCVWWLVPLR